MEEELNISNTTIAYCSTDEGGRNWWIFPVGLVSLYLSGLMAAFLYWAVDQSSLIIKRTNLPSGLKHKVSSIENMTSIYSKVFMFLVVASNLLYFTLFFYRLSLPIWICIASSRGTLGVILVELLVCLFLLVYFFFKLLAAKRSYVRFWLSVYSIVDILTLFHPIFSLVLGFDWLGVRALRFLSLPMVTKTLILLLPPLHSSISQDITRICKIAAQFLGLLLTTSGILYLLEASGDPWDPESAQDITFWTSAYFMIVTVSTVGYGDITMATTSGRIVTAIFIIGGLMYAVPVVLPSLIDITVSYYRDKRFRVSYEASPFNETLIVCGYVTPQSVESFLNELLHPDKHDTTTHVVFLHPSIPTQELLQVLKDHYTRVHYIVGTPFSNKDLHRCHIQKATAMVVLANREVDDPMDEDSGNLLRVIAVKNVRPSLRVILQLLRPSSKQILSSIRGWDHEQDILLCLNEIKLSILAQSCITPGFCALFSNLLTAVAYKQIQTGPEGEWRQLYMQGASNEIYTTQLSNYFHGMEIGKCAHFCYEHLGLTLLDIEPLAAVIKEDSIGYFIADTAKDVKTAASPYSSLAQFSFKVIDLTDNQDQPIPLTPVAPLTTPSSSTINSFRSSIDTKAPPISLPQPPPPSLANHIILCIFADKQNSGIGLSCFFSSLPESSVVVIVTDKDYMMKEWSSTTASCTVYYVSGNPLEWANLEAAFVHSSSVCILLTAQLNLKTSEYGINDKKVVLSTLKIHQQLGEKVVVLTDLAVESHVHLLDRNSRTDLQWFMAEPFACGHIFVSSILDSLTTVAFHTPGTVNLLDHFLHIDTKSSTTGCKSTCIIQVPISSDELRQFTGSMFSKVFNYFCFQNILCIAVYRQIRQGSKHKYVITAPPRYLPIEATDIIFAIKLGINADA